MFVAVSPFLGFWKFKLRPQLIRYAEGKLIAEAREGSVLWLGGGFLEEKNAATPA
jgi:hypothetical protein